MDQKQFVQFARWIIGSWTKYSVLVVRVSLGLFFAISEANKLFAAVGTKPVYETLVRAKVPFPRLTAYFVSVSNSSPDPCWLEASLQFRLRGLIDRY